MRIRRAVIDVILSRVHHGCASFEKRQRSKRLQPEGCRVPTCLRSVLLSFSLSPFSLVCVALFSFIPWLFFTHTFNFFSFLFPFFSFPAGLCNLRTSEIFVSWNAANWPKINTHVEECYPFSLSFSLLPHSESLCYCRSFASSVVTDRYIASETFSSNVSHNI